MLSKILTLSFKFFILSLEFLQRSFSFFHIIICFSEIEIGTHIFEANFLIEEFQTLSHASVIINRPFRGIFPYFPSNFLFRISLPILKFLTFWNIRYNSSDISLPSINLLTCF